MTTIRLGKKLIALRRDANMTQEELAAYMGVSKSSVSKWETETTLPDILLLPQLATLFTASILSCGSYPISSSTLTLNKVASCNCTYYNNSHLTSSLIILSISISYFTNLIYLVIILTFLYIKIHFIYFIFIIYTLKLNLKSLLLIFIQTNMTHPISLYKY